MDSIFYWWSNQQLTFCLCCLKAAILDHLFYISNPPTITKRRKARGYYWGNYFLSVFNLPHKKQESAFPIWPRNIKSKKRPFENKVSSWAGTAKDLLRVELKTELILWVHLDILCFCQRENGNISLSKIADMNFFGSYRAVYVPSTIFHL